MHHFRNILILYFPRSSVESAFFALVLISLSVTGHAQDAFFNNFQTGKSYFNPSLVGTSGSLSLTAKHKRQWNIVDPWFTSTYIGLEESLPCTFLDWGLSILFDREGTAGFTTREGAFNIAGTIPFKIGHHIHNVKIGLSPRYSQKSIDYNSLVFSDQLDPKYGPTNSLGGVNPTSFIPPDNSGLSNTFFSPSVGISLVSVWNAGKRNAHKVVTSFGAAITHVLNLSESFGNIESVQRLSAQIPARYSLFAEAEFRPINDSEDLLTITPVIFYHRQASLEYLEFGASVGYNRNVQFGLYAQYSPNGANQTSTNRLIGQFDIGMLRLNSHRVDLGVNISTSLTGIQNARGNTMEVSFTYHFNKSVTCALAGKDSVPSIPNIVCPGDKFANMKRYQDLFYYSITNWKSP